MVKKRHVQLIAQVCAFKKSCTIIKGECELDKSHMAYKKSALGIAFPLNESHKRRHPKIKHKQT
jgi:hypothetical protein